MLIPNQLEALQKTHAKKVNNKKLAEKLSF
jgi:hypothetical protein